MLLSYNMKAVCGHSNHFYYTVYSVLVDYSVLIDYSVLVVDSVLVDYSVLVD